MRFESLENRLLLATFTVTNLNDFGAGSLRQAIVNANNTGGADRVDLTGVSGTLAVALGELEITDALTITGPGANRLTLDAQQNSRIFNINTTAGNFSIAGLTLTGGRTTGDGIGLFDTTFRGGAIRSLTAGTLTITRSSVIENHTEGDDADGGGIFAAGNLAIIQSIVSRNSTVGQGSEGGGIRANGAMTLTQSTVSANSTTGDLSEGGGLLVAASNLTLTQSTVSGNSTAGMFTRGGGISAGGNVTLLRSTIADNHAIHATSVGGGIWNYNATVDISHSIVAGNTAGGGNPDIDPNDPNVVSLNINYSLIGVDPGGIVGANNITGIDPLLGPLAENGGPTRTHALLALSPAIDAGDPSIVFNAAEFDQRGTPFTRVVDGGGGLRIDMGAFERQNLSGTLVVDITADEDDGNYSVGDLSLREAIVLANGTDVDTVAFDPIVFGTPQVIALTLGEIEIGEAVTIDGPGQDLLTIDAQQNSRIFNIVAATADFTITDLTLTGGRTTGNGIGLSDTTYHGGAIRSLTFGTLTIDRSNISGNGTEGNYAAGGGIFAFGTVNFNQSAVSANSTSGFISAGGGIHSFSAAMLNQSTVSGNNTSGDQADGGGIHAGSVTLNQSTVSGNSTFGSGSNGGGIYAGLVTLDQSIVSGNSTAGSNADGGAIFAIGTVTVSQSTVSGNSTFGSSSQGGGVFTFGGVTLTESTVSGNSTAGDDSGGGGIVACRDSTVTESTVSGNSTAGSNADGGGILVGSLPFSALMTVARSTITDNHAIHATSTGGGIFILLDDNIDIRHSIVAGNTAGGGNPDLRPGTGTLDVDFSIIGDTSGLTAGELAAINAGALNQLNVDPKLGPLADNGGPTQTHNPLAGSPAIDAGNPFFFFDPNVFDQRGAPFVRVADGGVAGVRIDIGAYERQTVVLPSLIVDTAVDESDGDYSAGDFSLREAIGLANGSLGADVITFAPSLAGATIALVLGELGVVDSVSIQGLGADRLTVDAQQDSRIFNINDGDNANALDVAISGLTLTGGQADDDGGAIRSFESLTLARSVVSGSSVSGITNTGGGIYLRMFGGMTSTIRDSLIVGNSSGQAGGGMRTLTQVGDLLEIVNSTISGNSANTIGGGLWIAGDVNITHSTIAFNMADADLNGLGSGGGMTVSAGSRVTLDHTVVADNVDPTLAAPDISGMIDAYFSLLRDTTGVTISSGANNLLAVKPQLRPLADNGGPTRTHALLAGSPAIDMGDAAASPGVVNVPLFDQRGNNYGRVQNGRIDIGAFEVRAPLSADFDVDGDVDGGDFLAWQRGYGTVVPDAKKADGDADNDLDTDGNDLGVWQLQYNTVPPLVAGESGEFRIEDFGSSDKSQQLFGSDLVDLALAMEWMEQTDIEDDLFIDIQPTEAQAARYSVFASHGVVTMSRSAADSETLAAGSDEEDGGDETWLSESLLERVFG